jgi:hypothetical protein
MVTPLAPHPAAQAPAVCDEPPAQDAAHGRDYMGKRMWATLLRTKVSRRMKAFGSTKTLPVPKKMLGESQRSKGKALIDKGATAGKAAIQDSPTPR